MANIAEAWKFFTSIPRKPKVDKELKKKIKAKNIKNKKAKK